MNDFDLKNTSATDWERIDDMADEEIDTSDIAPLDEAFFANARFQTPSKSTVTLSVDSDVLQWFEAQGEGFQTRINAALRLYAEAHQERTP